MGTTYTQTVEVSVWKEHKCACCRTTYRYLFKRTMKGEGGTPEVAARNAERNVEKTLEKEVDQRPCPECGLYQPDMVAAKRATGHWWTLVAGAPVYLLLFILVMTDVMTFGTAAMVAAVCAVPILAAHFLIDASNPNRDRDANRKLARRMEKGGDLWVPEDKQPKELSDKAIGNGLVSGHYISYAMLAGAVALFLLPLGMRLVMGMKSNPGWYPDVAGPGDTPYVYFPDKISAVKGYWSSQPRVTVLNAADVGNPNVTAAPKQQDWGNKISISSKESKSSSPSLWTRLQLPADGSLAGKTLKLKIDMSVMYPAMMGTNQFGEQTTMVSKTVDLNLSSSGAGKVYKLSFWLGFIGGTALLLAAGALLPMFSNQFSSQAYETSIFVPEGRKDPEPPELDDDPIPMAGDEPVRDAIRADEDRPRKRRRDEEYEEDRPRRRDEDDDDRPKKRRRDEY
jgi:hypothetical protein